MLDQPMFGQVLAAHGAGLVLGQHPEVDDFNKAVNALLHDDSLGAGANAIGTRLRDEDGVHTAADRIDALVGAGVAP